MKSPSHRSRLFLLLLTLFLIPTALLAEWGDPSGFFDREKIERKELHPGVIWWSIGGQLNGKPLKTNLLTVDLAKSDLQAKTLVGERFVSLKTGQRFQRSRVSQLLDDNEVLAAINASFFDISATMAPMGLTMQDGMIFREPSGRTSLVLSTDGRAALGSPEWSAQIEAGSQRRPLNGINKPSLSNNEINLYQLPWAASPGNSTPFTENQKVREIVLEKIDFRPATRGSERSELTGRITEIRDNKAGVEIGENQFVLTATENAAPFFRNVRVGHHLTVSWELTNLPSGFDFHGVREIVSSSPVLITNGKVESRASSLWTASHPRSAIGISRDQTKLAVVLIDGRSAQSVGVSLHDLANFLLHLGSYNAINFDGGGSSALAAVVDGKSTVLNSPSGGSERYVPTGLGIAVVDGSLSGSRTWTGANGRQLKGVFQNYNPQTGYVTLVLAGRRYTIPIDSLSADDQALIRAHTNTD